MKTREIISYNILKANKNKLLLANKYMLGIIICIIRDNQEQFLTKKNFVYVKTKLIKLSRNTIIYYYKVSLVSAKYCNFYNKKVNCLR